LRGSDPYPLDDLPSARKFYEFCVNSGAKVFLLLVANQKTIALDGVCVRGYNVQNRRHPIINLVYTPINSL